MRLERFIIATILFSVIVAIPLAKTNYVVANKTSQHHIGMKIAVKSVPKELVVSANHSPVPPQLNTPTIQSDISTATSVVPMITCEQAIDQVWPADLQAVAIIVATHESSLQTDDIGPILPDGSIGYNYDGSRDYGCFQINDKAHPDFFANNDWSNPVANAQEGLKIYNDRGNWTAWYAVAGILY